MSFNLEDYEPVEERIKKFYTDNKDGRILTSIHSDDGKRIIIKAELYRDASDTVWASGFAEEVRGEGYVNKTSAVENCETSAIGRALANANYAGSKRPSREEMASVENKLKDVKTETISTAQRGKIFALLREKGYETVDQQRGVIEFLTGSESTAGLTKSEASKLIEDIEALEQV